jgi:phage terminase large subunit-like protein
MWSGIWMDSKSLQEMTEREAGRKLFREYKSALDDTRPPGPDNLGVYPWQQEFHNASADYPERLLMGGNRIGKTRIGSAEVAIHATGDYPSWWTGRKFTQPTQIWTGAETNEDSRDIIQRALLGQAGDYGTGWIPRSRIVDIKNRQAGVTEVVERIFVRHKSGGVSWIGLKTFAQEAKGWRGESLDVVWGDELIPMDIYTEALTRLIDRKGILLLTFTPMAGVTEVVRHFLEAKEGSGIYTKNVTWDDVNHLDSDEKKRLWSSYPAYEREARTKGTPMLGSGAIFPVPDEDITTLPQKIPAHWSLINGIDFGIDHPGAGVFCAWDKDSDTFYVYDCYKQRDETPIYHAAAMKKHGDWVPNAWPHDGNQRKQGLNADSNIKLKDMFRQNGLYMLREHAHYNDERGNSREASLIEMYEYMRTGRFKVFSTLTPWFEEKRMYHRRDGNVVAVHDDIMSATRYAFMMRRYAMTKPPATVPHVGPRKPIVGGRNRWHRNP